MWSAYNPQEFDNASFVGTLQGRGALDSHPGHSLGTINSHNSSVCCVHGNVLM
jgi:hypothetical protein